MARQRRRALELIEDCRLQFWIRLSDLLDRKRFCARLGCSSTGVSFVLQQPDRLAKPINKR